MKLNEKWEELKRKYLFMEWLVLWISQDNKRYYFYH